MSNVYVSRWVRGFGRVDGELKVEYRLPGDWTQERLQRLFDVPAHDPMYDSFRVNETQARLLGESIGVDLLVPEFTFLVEADDETPAGSGTR